MLNNMMTIPMINAAFIVEKMAPSSLSSHPSMTNLMLLELFRFKGDYNEAFDGYFGSMKLRKPGVDHLSGYTSWYNYFKKIDEKIILRDLDGLDRAKDGVSIFQIDDGFESKVGDWLVPDPKKFPGP